MAIPFKLMDLAVLNAGVHGLFHFGLVEPLKSLDV